MEELIHEEILQLFNKLDNQINLPLSMSLIYNVSVVNALWTIISGTRQGLLKGGLWAKIIITVAAHLRAVALS